MVEKLTSNFNNAKYFLSFSTKDFRIKTIVFSYKQRSNFFLFTIQIKIIFFGYFEYFIWVKLFFITIVILVTKKKSVTNRLIL